MNKSSLNFRDILLPEFLSDKEIINFVISPLTHFGINYGSVMLEVNLKLINIETKVPETLQVVAKKVVNNNYLTTLFQPHISFEKELNMYKRIIPELQKFQKENGVEEFIKDLVPKFYGGRLGLENGKFDSNAVLILENLKVQGYVLFEQTEGFDLDTSTLILRKLAQFHATSLALKIKNPEKFDNNIRPYLKKVVPSYNELIKVRNTLRIIANDSICAKYYTRVDKIVEKILENPPSELENDFCASICHGDFWVSNILVKFKDGIPEDIKYIDFQLMLYDSIGKDLVFFLYTSIRNEIIIENFDELLSNYHKIFIETLKLYKVNSTPFTFETIEEEMRQSFHRGTILQCLMMIFPIFSRKEPGFQIENVTEVFDDKSPSEKFLNKLRMMLSEFSKKGWI